MEPTESRESDVSTGLGNGKSVREMEIQVGRGHMAYRGLHSARITCL